jgi:hypothetical protein
LPVFWKIYNNGDCLTDFERIGAGCLFKDMPDQRIDVITYSGYRGEETPRSILIHHEKIDVVAILNRWIEEGIEDRARKRVFRVKGSDGKIRKIYYDEKETEWFYVVED